jgi:peroxiredoxin
MPLLDRFYQENKLNGWQILGIAIDQPSAVRRFQAQFPVSYPLVLGGIQGNEFGQLLGNETGSLPYTLVLDPQGRILQRKLGRLSPSDLTSWK